MRLRTLYGLIGLAGGLWAGAVAALAALGFAAGFGWLFLFGDSPWPAWSGGVIYGVSLAAGIGIGAACLAVALAYGVRVERAPPGSAKRARRAGYGILALIVAVYGASALVLVRHAAEDDRMRAEFRDRNEAFAGLLAARHRIAAIELARSAADRAAFRIATTGSRAGRYYLDWEVRERTYDKVLDRGRLDLDLAGDETATLGLNLQTLAEAYRDRVLSDPTAAVLVDQSFALELMLVPELSEAESAGLPANERQNLRLGYSELIQRRSAELPVRFLIRGGTISFQ